MFKKNSLVKTSVISVSLIVSFVSLFLSNEGSYRFVPVIPFSFFLSVLLFREIFDDVPSNFGATMLVFLMFFRSVVYVLVYQLSGHYSRIPNVTDSIELACWLMAIENVVVFLVLWFMQNKKSAFVRRIDKKQRLVTYNEKKMNWVILVLLVLFLMTILIVPDCLRFYKTFLQIGDSQFTSNETEVSFIVATYGNTFVRKLVMVIHTYLMKLLRFLIPLQLIVLVFKRDKKRKRFLLCCLFSLSTLLVLDGSIARSVIYSFSLLYVSAMLYSKKQSLYRIIGLTAFAVACYFAIRLSVSTSSNGSFSPVQYTSGLFGAYFSGIDNTAAVIRLESSLPERFLYLACDYFQSIPFGNTIFGVSDVSFQSFFNSFNSVQGQIPTTIGVGYYYFGFLGAPLYSALFAFLAYRFGIRASHSNDPLLCGIFAFGSLISAMGIVSYYVQISFASLLGPFLQLLILSYFVKERRPCLGGQLNESFAN